MACRELFKKMQYSRQNTFMVLATGQAKVSEMSGGEGRRGSEGGIGGAGRGGAGRRGEERDET